jgi:hypothetical protein
MEFFNINKQLQTLRNKYLYDDGEGHLYEVEKSKRLPEGAGLKVYLRCNNKIPNVSLKLLKLSFSKFVLYCQ